MKSNWLIILLLFLYKGTFAQAPFISLNNNSNLYTQQKFVLPLKDGGYAIKEVYADSSSTQYELKYHIVIAKYTGCHELIWSKDIFVYSGLLPYNWNQGLIETTDGGIVASYSGAMPYTWYAIPLITKFESNGKLLWTKKINIRLTQYLNGKVPAMNSSVATADGGIVISGFIDTMYNGVTQSDTATYFLLKLKADGKIKWSKRLRIANNLWTSRSCIYPQDNSVIFYINGLVTTSGNQTMSFPSRLIKIDSLGNLLWTRTLNLSLNAYRNEQLNNINEDANHNIYISGNYDSLQFTYPYLLKTDQNGKGLWMKFYRTQDIGFCMANYGLAISGNNIGMTNFSSVFSMRNDFNYRLFITGIDLNGNVRWNKIFSPIQKQRLDDVGLFKLSPTIDSGFITMGPAKGQSESVILKTDKNGIVNCDQKDTPLYAVSLKVFTATASVSDCDQYWKLTDTVVHSMPVKNHQNIQCSKYFIPQADLGNDTLLCSNDSIILSAESNNKNCRYLWNTGDTTYSVTIKNSGKYWLSISHVYCTSTDSINITFYKKLKRFPKHDLSICQHDSILLMLSDTAKGIYWTTPKHGSVYRYSFWCKDSGMYYEVLSTKLPCRIVDSVHVKINVLPKASAGPDTILCYNQSYTMQGKGGITYKWIPAKYLSNDTLPDAVATLPDSQLYTLVVHNAEGCSDTSTVKLRVRPRLQVHIGSSNTSVSCNGDNILFTASGEGGYKPDYTYYWPYDHAKGDSVRIQVNSSGWHKVILQDNCSPPATDSIYITVPPKPVADFSMRPDSQVSAGTDISFYNLSRNSSHYYWNFGDRQKSSAATESPVFTYKDTGLYKISLIAWNNEGCSDTAVKYIHVLDNFLLYIPNAFSPNDDGLNDEFRIEGSAIKSISYSIYNRWGERIFQSTPEEPSWNGRFNNQGDKSPTGIYLYILKATDNLNEPYYYKGTVEVVR